MYAFLEDCPLGFENEGLMFEACLVEAEKANLALDMCNALHDIDRRKAYAKRDSLGMDFNALMSFYESDNSGGGEQKQGLVKKAWGAIAALFQSISNIFAKMSGKKVPDGTYEARAELPTFLQKIAEFLSKVTEVVNLRNLAALMGAAMSADNLLNWLSNVWFTTTGKKTKRFQANEIQKMLQSAQEAETKYTELIKRIDAKDIEQGFDKEWNAEKAKAEAEKAHLTEKLKEVNNGTIWGRIRGAFTKIGNAIKSTVTNLWNKIFNKDSGDESDGDGGENNTEGEKSGDDSDNKDKSDQSEGNGKSEGNDSGDGKSNGDSNGSGKDNGGDNTSDTNKSNDGAGSDKKDSNTPAENNDTESNQSDKSNDNSGNDSSGNSGEQGSDESRKGFFGRNKKNKKNKKNSNKPHGEDVDSDSGDLFDTVMESLDEILSADTPTNPIYEEDDDMDERYNAYRNAEGDIEAGYEPGEFDEEDGTAFEGYDLEDVEEDGSDYSEEANEFDLAFGDYMTEEKTGNTTTQSFTGYDIDGAGYDQYTEEDYSDDSYGDDDEFDESAWEAELDALCDELMED